eukprot:2428034-Alexandrium_andersonii.AAC.1
MNGAVLVAEEVVEHIRGCRLTGTTQVTGVVRRVARYVNDARVQWTAEVVQVSHHPEDFLRGPTRHR